MTTQKKEKELTIVRTRGTGMYHVQFEGGGQLPKELEGLFTDKGTAQQKIDMYVELKKTKSTK